MRLKTLRPRSIASKKIEKFMYLRQSAKLRNRPVLLFLLIQRNRLPRELFLNNHSVCS